MIAPNSPQAPTAWIPPSKDERYRIARLAKRVRGLYSAEQQSLHFVAEAQTMERGVCSQALKRHAADYGYNKRHLQCGIHGRRRNGKLEYPGLLARGIVFVVGGYPKGGLAPGGQGLTPDYAINLEVMMTFIPEIDDEYPNPPASPNPSEPVETPQKGDTMGEPKGEPFSRKGEPKGELMPTSSLSSSLGTVPTVQRAASDVGAESERCNVETVDDDGKIFVLPGGFCVSPSVKSVSAVNPSASPSSTSGESPIPPGAQEGTPNPESVHGEKQSQPQIENPEDAADQIIASVRQRQLSRKASVSEIYHDFKAVFDRLTLERQILLDWTPPPKAHQTKAAEFYRAVGRDIALQAWEQFLVNGEHDIPQKQFNDETGEEYTAMVQRTWLLLCFVNEQPDCAAQPPSGI